MSVGRSTFGILTVVLGSIDISYLGTWTLNYGKDRNCRSGSYAEISLGALAGVGFGASSVFPTQRQQPTL